MTGGERESQESPHFQSEESGAPAENEAEQQAREDYNQEREETGNVDMSEPDWAEGMGPDKD